ncbi:MAG: hypothetical protein ACI9G1_004358 [Pirellulaceae bacterium]|jgi:hypothetical protein
MPTAIVRLVDALAVSRKTSEKFIRWTVLPS